MARRLVLVEAEPAAMLGDVCAVERGDGETREAGERKVSNFNRITIRGYAAVFNDLALIGEAEWETILRGAFARMFVEDKPVRLQFDTHDAAPAMASTRDGTLHLFEDEHGLGFEADVKVGANFGWSEVRRMVHGGHQACSVNFVKTIAGRARRPIGRSMVRARVIMQATIDHVAIVDAPTYRSTCCWRADASVDRAQYKIHENAKRWARGREIAASHQASPATIAARTDRRAPLEFHLAPRQARYAALRQKWARGALVGKMNGQIMAHAAFSKAGGFDGDFDNLLNEAARGIR